MRHRKSPHRLNAKPQHARMMQRNLVTSLLLYESIRTTQKRAKAVAPLVDRLVAVAKSKPPRIAIRVINAVVTDRNACRKIMEVLKDRYSSRSSGLTRAVPVGARLGDGAHVVDLSLVDAEASAESKEKRAESKEQRAKRKSSSTSKTSTTSK